jgi:hypothetical protein
MFIFVGRNDVLTGTTPEDFARQLEEIVQACARAGAIPVLATIPGDPATYPALNDLNAIIATLAEDNHLPLLNVWRRVMGNAPATGISPDLTLTTSGVGDNLVPDEMNVYGVPNRNLIALRMLQQLRLNVPIP